MIGYVNIQKIENAGHGIARLVARVAVGLSRQSIEETIVPTMAMFVSRYIWMLGILLTQFSSTAVAQEWMQEEIVHVMFEEEQRLKLYKWDSYPVAVFAVGATDAQTNALVRTIKQINTVAGTTVLELSDIRNKEIGVSVVFSQVGSFEYGEFFSAAFLERFGEKEHAYWDSYGDFDFPYSEETPCFMISIANDATFFSGHAGRKRPDLAFVSVANAGKKSAIEMQSCLLEELAHAAFFIPDWYFYEPDLSIFNTKPFEDAIREYSEFDEWMIQTLMDERLVNEMTQRQFILALREIVAE